MDAQIKITGKYYLIIEYMPNLGGLNSGLTYGFPDGVANGMSGVVNLWNRVQTEDYAAAVSPATLRQPIYFQGQNYTKDQLARNANEMNTTPARFGPPLGWALRA